MRYAILSGITVSNVIVADADFAANMGAVACPDEVGPGWLYDGVNWSPPPGQTDEEKAAEVRAQRNTLLAECDWTQLADAPGDKAAWATYRQELRDISTQPGFPWTVDWPVAPGA
jgi:hypothetical protein